MRRLRALMPFAGRRSCTAGVVARSSQVGPGSGRVDRRRLLTLLGAAPIALPAVARAAMASGPFSETVFFDVNGSYAASLARWDVKEAVRAGCAPLSAAVERLALLDAYERAYDDVDAVFEAVRGFGLPTVAATHPFIDDVGSGP